MNKSILSSLLGPLTPLALNRTAVLTDALRGVEYDRSQKAFRFGDKLPSNIDCLIIGKEHYNEENRKFPIQSRKELSKILKLEALNNDNVMLYSIGDYIDGERIVTCWQVKTAVFESRQLNPLMVLPESALLHKSEPGKLLTLTRDNRTFWFIDRQGQYLCAEKKGLISNGAMFLASAGLSDQIDSLELDDNSYLALLTDALIPVLSKNLSGFNAGLRRLESVDWATHLKYSGVSAVVLLSAYFGATSLYLNMRLDSAKTAATEYREKTKDIFELKNLQSSMEQKGQALAEVNDTIMAPNVIWRLVAPLMRQGVTFRRIGMRPNGLFSFEVEADKATDVLEFLSGDPLVFEPQFQGQNSAVDNRQRFTVIFKIQEKS